ncbi:MAG: hypothetical protein AAGB24_00575 [Bacteroidota bacterium]
MKFLNDSDPIYLETVAGRFPVEPWNTYSNLIFLAILIYWGIRVYPNYRSHYFLAGVLPIIFVSYVGGSLYHATRSAEIWLLLDWMPIMLLCFALVIYLICKLVKGWWQRTVFIFVLLGTSFLFRLLPMPQGMQISLGYVITAFTILFPLSWYLIRTEGKNIGLVVTAFLVFGLAIYFRTIDLHQTLLRMGTHWLWHLLGGTSVHFLIAYVFKDNLLHLSAANASTND